MNPVESSESNRKKISRDSISGRSAAWLARLLWEQEVGSSNLPAPTLLFRRQQPAEAAISTNRDSCTYVHVPISSRFFPRLINGLP